MMRLVERAPLTTSRAGASLGAAGVDAAVRAHVVAWRAPENTLSLKRDGKGYCGSRGKRIAVSFEGMLRSGGVRACWGKPRTLGRV